MKCIGKFKYKGYEIKEAGSFINEKGKKVEYSSKYAFKLDEIVDEGACERIIKVELDNPIIMQLKSHKLYDDVTIEFDLQFTSNGSPKLTPKNVIK